MPIGKRMTVLTEYTKKPPVCADTGGLAFFEKEA